MGRLPSSRPLPKKEGSLFQPFHQVWHIISPLLACVVTELQSHVSYFTVWTRAQVDFTGIALVLHAPAEDGVRADADEFGRVAQSGPKCLAAHMLYENRSWLLHGRSVCLSIQKVAKLFGKHCMPRSTNPNPISTAANFLVFELNPAGRIGLLFLIGRLKNMKAAK